MTTETTALAAQVTLVLSCVAYLGSPIGKWRTTTP